MHEGASGSPCAPLAQICGLWNQSVACLPKKNDVAVLWANVVGLLGASAVWWCSTVGAASTNATLIQLCYTATSFFLC